MGAGDSSKGTDRVHGDINLEENAVGVLARHLVKRRADALARNAPLGGEVDAYKLHQGRHVSNLRSPGPHRTEEGREGWHLAARVRESRVDVALACNQRYHSPEVERSKKTVPPVFLKLLHTLEGDGVRQPTAS